MFDEKYVSQYRAIAAPPELKERVLSDGNVSRSVKVISFPRKALTAAACVAVVAVSMLAFVGNNVSVSLSPAAVAESRSYDVSVVVDIDVKNSAVVKVSNGTLNTLDGRNLDSTAEINGNTQLRWIVDFEEDYVLTVESSGKTKQYSLVFNEHSQMWELEKI